MVDTIHSSLDGLKEGVASFVFEGQQSELLQSSHMLWRKPRCPHEHDISTTKWLPGVQPDLIY